MKELCYLVVLVIVVCMFFGLSGEDVKSTYNDVTATKEFKISWNRYVNGFGVTSMTLENKGEPVTFEALFESPTGKRSTLYISLGRNETKSISRDDWIHNNGDKMTLSATGYKTRVYIDKL